MAARCFPVVYADVVESTAAFYELLGFERHFQLPAEGEAGYVGLRSDGGELAVVASQWPQDQFGMQLGTAPRFEMFVYVDDVDGTLERLRMSGTDILRPAEDMPWGERVGYVSDPDGNPVAVAAPVT
ncbi:MAG: VOC family protein [Actinomycetota bacterium]|jgi:lactoylglutathione lyase|nr:VOC family protein [Euzebyaceae bacterium]MBA3991582.1 VOC family protein [Propionibacteriales bacterium]MDQ3451450.1 VOC family protein [Actinomycetota bacterium]